MASNYLEDELIDSFLNGNLKGEELLNFESRMNSDSNFASKVKNQESFNRSVEDYELAKFHSKLDKFNPYKSSQNFNLFAWKYLALGIAVVSGITIGGITLINSSSNQTNTEVQTFIKEQEKNNAPVLLNNSHMNTKEVLVQGKGQKTKDLKAVDDNLSMYDYLENDELSKNNIGLNSDELASLDKSSDPSYVVVGKEIQEEDVLVISSNYNKTMKYVKDHKCSNLSLNAKIEVVSDCNVKSGRIKVIEPKVSGGKAPFLYGLNSGEFQESLIFDDLSKGAYQIKVKDAEGCIIEYHDQVSVELLECE